MALSDILNKFSKIPSHHVYVTLMETPLGKLISAADDEFLYMILFEDSKNNEKQFHILSKQLTCSFIEGKNKLLEGFQKELNNYLSGKLKKFTIPVKMIGSKFQKDVWNELLNIPYAETQTYGNIAKALGRPVSHSRAVGAACGANAHVIVIPCHRIVAASSKGGFSCGLDRKEWLLQHESNFNSV